eukprot:11207469-Lingulodinium_polyedra.AAC.1
MPTQAVRVDDYVHVTLDGKNAQLEGCAPSRVFPSGNPACQPGQQTDFSRCISRNDSVSRCRRAFL